VLEAVCTVLYCAVCTVLYCAVCTVLEAAMNQVCAWLCVWEREEMRREEERSDAKRCDETR
jgi:hypothetical protein